PRHERTTRVAKFLFVYRKSREPVGSLSPEEMQQMLQKWNAWITEGLRQGWMLDAGDALKPEGRVVGARLVSDRPFVASKEVVGGFSIVHADTLDTAAHLAKDCPGLLLGGTVEVRPLQGYTAGK